MTSAELETLGCFLFGPRWQSRLARSLGVTVRLVQYWAAGKRPIGAARERQVALLVTGQFCRRRAAQDSQYKAMVSSPTAHHMLREAAGWIWPKSAEE